MKKYIVLDSPLGLLLQKAGYRKADECREWIGRIVGAGAIVLVPEIVDYEIRRELLRLKTTASLARFDSFYANAYVKGIPFTSAALRLAAELWARARQRGTPTANPHALDVDVILSAQVLATGLAPADFVVATSNVTHISLFVPAGLWSTI